MTAIPARPERRRVITRGMLAATMFGLRPNRRGEARSKRESAKVLDRALRGSGRIARAEAKRERRRRRNLDWKDAGGFGT